MKRITWGVIFKNSVCAALAALPLQSSAYEIQTHRALSVAAFNGSTWAGGPAPARLGLASFPNGTFPSSAGSLSPRELVQYGAQNEDDGIRPVNHFFDPYRAVGLPFAQPSPDWILNGASVPAYTYQDALAYLRSALSESTAESRNSHWALVFETLGRVIHHVQDMAQPQHVRGDLHFHRDWPLVGDPSLYEACTEAGLLNPPPTRRCGDPLSHGTYPIVRLARVREYWTTTSADANGGGRGMADFTNANFVSKDSNFRLVDDRLVLRARDYPKPTPTGLRTYTLDELGLADVCDELRRDPRAFGRAASCEIEFASTEVVDAYTGVTRTNERAASLSVFDQYLSLRPDGPTYAVDRLFTLNRFNYAAAQAFLLPRAIGYSAGLIDHFFRGRLEPGEVHARDGVLTIEVENISAEGNAFGPGTFQLYYDSASGQRKALRLQAGADIGMQQFAPGQKHVLTAQVPGDVDLNVDKPLVIVYSGIIGAEEAVAGLVLEAPQLYEGFVFHVNGDLPDRAGRDRLIYLSGGQWRLHPQGNVALGGNVDWKGWYVDGKATRVLTWSGPGRYGEGPLTNYYPQIYQHGKTLVVAPGPVLGAALQKDAQGNAWVVAICADGDKDVAYVRPARRDTSPALYDAQSAPDGWRLLGDFQSSPEMTAQRGPWLFNGDGTEAQSMRRLKAGPLTRLKASVTPDSAHFADVGNTRGTYTVERTRDWECGRASPPLNAWTRTRTEGEHVVAVDYAGNDEVLAKLIVEANTEWHSFLNPSDTDNVGSSTTTESSVWRLQLGGTMVPMFEQQGTSQASYRVSWTEGQQGENYAFDRERQSATKRTHLAFLDLRNRTLISSNGQVDYTSTERLQDNRTLSQTTTHKANFVRMLAVPGGALAEVNRTPVVGAPVSSTRTVNDFWYEIADPMGEPFRCDPSAPSEPSTPMTVDFTATFAMLPDISYPSNMQVSTFAAAATDRNGNFFWSMRYRNGPSFGYSRISRIAGVNVDSITGLGAAEPTEPPYTEIHPN